jgi:hypothetical protein
MKSIFSFCLVFLLMVMAVPSAANYIDTQDQVQYEQVIDMPSADQVATQAEFESFDYVMIDVGKDASQLITTDFEDDHQVFSAEFRQYEQLKDRADTKPKTARGHRSMNHSPPQIGFN